MEHLKQAIMELQATHEADNQYSLQGAENPIYMYRLSLIKDLHQAWEKDYEEMSRKIKIRISTLGIEREKLKNEIEDSVNERNINYTEKRTRDINLLINELDEVLKIFEGN